MPKSTKSPQSSTTKPRTRKPATKPAPKSAPSLAEVTPSVVQAAPVVETPPPVVEPTRSIVQTTPFTAPSAAAATITMAVDHNAIARRAYELFLRNGAMHGRDLEHWLQAESELRSRSVNGGH